MLARFDERAAAYDRENSFFDEDWEELTPLRLSPRRRAGRVRWRRARPRRVRRLQTRLAYHAAPTALGVNMHIYWTGVAADLMRMGDRSCRWILEKAAEGEVFAAIHGEPGNDLPLLLSTTSATRVEGGWKLNGHKIFGSPVAGVDLCRLPRHGHVRPCGAAHRARVRAPLAPGLQIVETWDTLGMRATQSQDTVLTDVFVPDELCPARLPGGLRRRRTLPVGHLRLGPPRLRRRLPGCGARAFDIAVDGAQQRTLDRARRGSMAHHPEVQHNIADMRMALDATDALLDRTAADWATGVAHADWPVRLVGTRYTRDHQGIRGRRPGHGPLRRVGCIQAQPPGADLPRRAHGPLPSRQHAAGPRADRQALPRPQPRRRPPLGLSATTSDMLPVLDVLPAQRRVDGAQALWGRTERRAPRRCRCIGTDDRCSVCRAR